jgi:hypothetical protein
MSPVQKLVLQQKQFMKDLANYVQCGIQDQGKPETPNTPANLPAWK